MDLAGFEPATRCFAKFQASDPEPPTTTRRQYSEPLVGRTKRKRVLFPGLSGYSRVTCPTSARSRRLPPRARPPRRYVLTPGWSGGSLPSAFSPGLGAGNACLRYYDVDLSRARVVAGSPACLPGESSWELAKRVQEVPGGAAGPKRLRPAAGLEDGLPSCRSGRCTGSRTLRGPGTTTTSSTPTCTGPSRAT